MAYSIDLSPFSGFVHHPDQSLTFVLLSIRSLFVKTWLTRMFTIPISSLFCSFLPTHVVQRNDWNPVWTLCMHSLHISLHVRMRLICVIYINPVMQTGNLILHGNGMNSEVSNVCFFLKTKSCYALQLSVVSRLHTIVVILPLFLLHIFSRCLCSSMPHSFWMDNCVWTAEKCLSSPTVSFNKNTLECNWFLHLLRCFDGADVFLSGWILRKRPIGGRN